VLNFEFIANSSCDGPQELERGLGAIETQSFNDDGRDTYQEQVLKKAFIRNVHRVLDDDKTGEDARSTLAFVREP
jgi:hypothetical protein